jgi:hypothetical protein
MPPAGDPEEERKRHQRSIALKDFILDSNRRATELGVAALKTVLLINGAAAIALLAFLAQLAGRDGAAAAREAQLLGPLALLVYGVLSGAVAMGFGYLRMLFEGLGYGAEIKRPGGMKPWFRAAAGCLHAAIALAAAAYVLFGLGMFEASRVLAAMVAAR